MKKVSMNGKKNNYEKSPIVNQISTKPKKQFQLYYRQRDQSAPQNEFQSIIFVKSKRCKPDQNLNLSKSHNKKNKVNEQFKKIMKDLDTHLKQNKPEKQQKSVSKQFCSGKPSLKTTGLSKNRTNYNDQNTKPKKLTERSIGKHSKKVNNYVQIESQNFTSKNIVSPKKYNPSKQNIKSPKSKIHESKHQRKAVTATGQSKVKLSQRIELFDRIKSPLKTRIQLKQKNQDKARHLNTSPKSKQKNKSNIHVNHSKNKKINCKENYQISEQIQEQSNSYSEKMPHNPNNFINNNHHKLDLNQEQYIFLDGDIVQTNDKSLFQLQNRLLSTYRNFQNNAQNSVNYQKNCQAYEKYLDFAQNHAITDRAEEQSGQTSKNCSKKNSQLDLKIVQLFLVKKVVFIQRWWKKIMKQKLIKIKLNKCLNLGKVKINKFAIQSEQKIQSSIFEAPHFSSQESIAFGTPGKQISCIGSKKDILFQRSEQFALTERSNMNSLQITLIAQRQNAARDQKAAHQQIIQNLLCQNKISLDCYNQKLNEIEQEYQKELQEIQKMKQFLTKNAQKVINLKNKLIQDKKLASNINSQNDEELFTKIFGKKQHSIHHYEEQQQIQVKNYHIGPNQESKTKNFTAQITQQQHSKSQQNQGISSKYAKKTNQNGDQYYVDFQQKEQLQQQMKIDQSQFQIQSLPEGFHPQFMPNTNFTELLEEFKQQQIVKNEVDTRIAYQMGAIYQGSNSQKSIPYKKVDTSIIGIHKFLNNFFTFYSYYFKNDFLRLVNMPYGYQPQKRLSFIQGYEDTSDDVQEDQDGILYGLQFVMPDQALQDYYDQFYSQALEECDKNSYERQIIECQKIHNRSIFDTFNEALNNFRPYYGINGPPYPWTNSQKALTFYFIAQQNIQQVFQKTQYKVLKYASALLGVSIQKYQKRQNSQTDELETVLCNYKKSSHPLILQCRQERQIKQQKVELLDSIYKWNNFQQQKCGLLIQISSLILEELTEQFRCQFKNIRSWKIFDIE